MKGICQSFHLGSVYQILNQVTDCVYFHCSTACLVGITGVLAPLLEETIFRGFLMTSLTKWNWLPSYIFPFYLRPVDLLIKFFPLFDFTVLSFPYIIITHVKETTACLESGTFSFLN